MILASNNSKIEYWNLPINTVYKSIYHGVLSLKLTILFNKSIYGRGGGVICSKQHHTLVVIKTLH